MTPLYTRTGDRGETSLTGARVPKDHARVEALGTVDELNAAVGAALVHVRGEDRRRVLEEVQNVLFTVGAELSAAGGAVAKAGLPQVSDAHVEALEAHIDGMRGGHAEEFVLPRGTEAAASLQVTRAVARRAERRVVTLSKMDGERVAPVLIRYLNRLSSLLFVLALRENEEAGVEEVSPTYRE